MVSVAATTLVGNPLIETQLPSWYAKHERHALKSVVIPLPEGFLGFLEEDGVFLPDDSLAVPRLDVIDQQLIVEGEYRRDDWGQLTQTATPGADRTSPSPGHAAPGTALEQPGGPDLSACQGPPASGAELAESSSEASSGSDSDEGDAPEHWGARFPELRAAIDAAIGELGGRVVPKLNWSCPSDALWVSATNSLACRNAEEVVLLLKSSDRVAHDLSLLSLAGARQGVSGEVSGCSGATPDAVAPSCAGAQAADGLGPAAEGRQGEASGLGGPAAGSSGQLRAALVLKKWYNLRPEREFRCFVRRGHLVAACQRDVSQAFPTLTPDVVAQLRGRLWEFWKARVQGSLGLDDFAFDVYVPSDGSGVRLIDVNPLVETTSPLLFEWTELGFAAGCVPAADALLRRVAAARGGPERGGATAPATDDGLESWMDEAAGPAALPVPQAAHELQVRLVEAGHAPVGPGGDAGGALGRMMLGARAACGMPYDMLGLADSADKIIECLQRQQQQEGKAAPAPASERPMGHSTAPAGGCDEQCAVAAEEATVPGLMAAGARASYEDEEAAEALAAEVAAVFRGVDGIGGAEGEGEGAADLLSGGPLLDDQVPPAY